MFVELFLLALLITLVVLSIRRGKSVVLDQPLVIQSPGRYHITLAPQLDRAQTFIEQIAGQFAQSHPPQGELPSQFFEVRDPDVLAQEGKYYMLAVSYRGGLLYFQAINPQPLMRDDDSQLKQVREFSEAVLALHPLKHPADGDEAEKLRVAVEMAARQLKITVKILTEAD
jgi:hypothetical protein